MIITKNSIKTILTKSALLFSVLATTACLAADSAGADNMSSMQKFYYELGVSHAKKEYFEKGFKSALKEFQELLKTQEKKWQAYEAGKYYMEEGMLTYPQVYRAKRNGEYTIKIEPSTITRKFDVNELFIAPVLENYENGNIDIEENVGAIPYENENILNSFSGFDRSESQNTRPQKQDILNQQVAVDIRFGGEILKRKMDNFNLDYITKKDGYRIYFKNITEKEHFCTEMLGNPRCKQ